MAASLRAGLAGFDTIDFIGRDADGTRDPAGDATASSSISCRDPRRGDVTLELQNATTGQVLLSRILSAATARRRSMTVSPTS